MCCLRYGDVYETYNPERSGCLGGRVPASIEKTAKKDATDALPGLQCSIRGWKVMASLTSRSIAEGVGTLLLVYFGAGAAAITLMIANGTKPATTFNIGIGQLGGLGDWFAIGISFGIVIAGVIYALGRVSGAHINPAVTIALWATKRFPAGDTVAYVIAQCIGAAIGSLLFFLTVGMGAVTIGGLGATTPFPGYRVWAGNPCRGNCDICANARDHGCRRGQTGTTGICRTHHRSNGSRHDYCDRQHRRGIA